MFFIIFYFATATIYDFVNNNEPFNYLGLLKIDSLAYRDLVPDPEDERRQAKKSVGSVKFRLVEKNRTILAPTYEETAKITNELWRNIGYLSATFYLLSAAHQLKEHVNSMNLEEKYRKILWEDANAITERFDIRALYHLNLAIRGGPSPTDTNILSLTEKEEGNSEFLKIIRRLNKFLDDSFKYKKEDEELSIPADYKEWQAGEEYYINLKSIVEGQK